MTLFEERMRLLARRAQLEAQIKRIDQELDRLYDIDQHADEVFNRGPLTKVRKALAKMKGCKR